MSDHPPIVAETLTVHGDFTAEETAELATHWSKLDQRLQSFQRESLTIDLYVRDRDTAGQHVTLDVGVAGFGTFVAKDASRDLSHSLNQVRDELIRQLTDAKNKSEPRNNRHLRDTTRH